MQYVKDKNGNRTQVYTNGGFLVGGTVSALNSYNNGQMITAQTGDIFNPANGPLANYLNMGDSGSPCLLMIPCKKMGTDWRAFLRN